MPAEIPLDLALRIVQRRCQERGIALVMPGDPYRTAALYGLAAYHAILADGWSLDHAREHTSMTLPGTGPLADALNLIPIVGPILAALARRVERPTVYLAPSALASGPRLLGVLAHEEGHVGDIRRGGALWCLAYGIVPEVRAGAEAPCYACDMAVRHALEGVPVGTVEADALTSLRSYGLGDAEHLAEVIVRSNAETLRRGGDPGGIVAEILAELEREGWQRPTVEPS